MSNDAIAGGIARALSVSLMYPIDTLKSRHQYSQMVSYTSFYKGLPYTVATQAVYGMLVFGVYENVKKSGQATQAAKAAMIGDLVGSLFLCPTEVVKQNVQVGRYKTAIEAFANIYKHAGIRGFYAGYTSLLARDVPFRMIQMPLYEKMKQTDDYGYSGAVASMTAAVITNPIDVIKTRLMCGQPLQNISLNTLFRGLQHRVLYVGGLSTLFFVFYENL